MNGASGTCVRKRPFFLPILRAGSSLTELSVGGVGEEVAP